VSDFTGRRGGTGTRISAHARSCIPLSTGLTITGAGQVAVPANLSYSATLISRTMLTVCQVRLAATVGDMSRGGGRDGRTRQERPTAGNRALVLRPAGVSGSEGVVLQEALSGVRGSGFSWDLGGRHDGACLLVWRGEVPYSYRSASIGSIRLARRAGKKPKNTPTAVENRIATTAALKDMTIGHFVPDVT
jgi:hypothetical protein